MKRILIVFAAVAMLASCNSKKRLAEIKSLQEARDKAVASLTDCDQRTADLRTQLSAKDTDLQGKDKQVSDLQAQVDYLKKTNTNLLDRMSDLSIVSKAGAESIKKSLETLNEQTKYTNNLNSSIQRKDSLNLALVMSLKRSLDDINDQDVQVEVKKGVVYVSLSDKLLFKSGSYEVLPAAETVLGKVAKVVNDHKELDILVEGHTDAVPIATSSIKDNWDLSALRATSVVRTLQSKFAVAPERMTAGGRSEFSPKDDNMTPTGRQQNRRTEIIITPKLDQFFNLMSSGQAGGSK
ncbi:OmpA/MotB family protein [Spirosoma endophyticum]|uniref:Chemotaxis protein MotB n=1 Tax=Spirosoma endophyticum TaxID=662367 RepID=A0A1I1T530_9BACT|nr:flagellar motor protein MotB [Spirosoma endophyticum]SFD52218.1 chemotaxis protein MotB [Spirosoma endophyticum]